MGSFVWLCNGMIVVVNVYKGKVKLIFMYGVKLFDFDQLFNDGFDGNVWWVIDFFEGDRIDKWVLKNFVCVVIEYNCMYLKKNV